ncbi:MULTISPECIES: hypothetical protein [unclassified Psychrobacter]|uniref:hypothetical protein n=1 Tax=unclassified Psychrobacter TaxID=196806 RepID=UPI0025DD627B|nr:MULTISPECIES: hypothetical protein [unclassified Psychrobacter]
MKTDMVDLVNLINDRFIEFTKEQVFSKETDDFLGFAQQKFKLNSKNDWNEIIASEDILEDSNEALKSFLKFGLSGPTKYNDLGEKYLRLYGVLNAVYQQQQAILHIFKLFNCPNPKSIKQEFNNLSITQARHKLGAHSINYTIQGDSETEMFVPVRLQFDDYELTYFNPKNDESNNIDLKLTIEEHSKLICKTYLLIANKVIKTVYKGNISKQEQVLSGFNNLEKVMNGAWLVQGQNGDTIINIKFK